VCPTSNLNTRVVRDIPELRTILRRFVEHEVPFTLSTDGPEMLRSHLRDEIALLLRHEIMSLDEIQQAIETAHRASFVGGAAVPIGPAPISLKVEV
jgi:Adenosine deaminase